MAGVLRRSYVVPVQSFYVIWNQLLVGGGFLSVWKHRTEPPADKTRLITMLRNDWFMFSQKMDSKYIYHLFINCLENIANLGSNCTFMWTVLAQTWKQDCRIWSETLGSNLGMQINYWLWFVFTREVCCGERCFVYLPRCLH